VPSPSELWASGSKDSRLPATMFMTLKEHLYYHGVVETLGCFTSIGMSHVSFRESPLGWSPHLLSLAFLRGTAGLGRPDAIRALSARAHRDGETYTLVVAADVADEQSLSAQTREVVINEWNLKVANVQKTAIATGDPERKGTVL